MAGRPKKILGLWSGHDASFCLLDDGKPVIHTEAERHLRVKEPPYDSIKLFYEHCGDESDIVGLATCHRDVGIKEHVESWKKISRLDVPLYVCGHHQSHAANAFYSSNFENATVVTIDGGGIEDESGFNASVSLWEGNDTQLKKLLYFPIHQVNIGGVWSRLTRYIFRYESGWPQGHQAGTVMALAALGKSLKYVDEFRALMTRDLAQVVAQPPGHVKGMSAKDPLSPQHPFLKRFEDIANANEQEKYDMALALQTVTEELVRAVIGKALTMSSTKDYLCLSGGVALNSVAMGKILEWFPQLKGVYIPPVPYDGGLTIGAAQHAWHHVLGNPRVKWEDNTTPYLGKLYSEEEVKKELAPFIESGQLSVKNADDDRVVRLLLKGKIISVFNGRAESGRRALGNRSILADPRDPAMKNKVNDKVKHRQWFRPFAPSVIREAVKDLFETDVESPFMGFVRRFKPEVKDKLPAIVHFDGTARLQTVTEKDNPWYHGFIKKWGIASGYPIVLNTSFNDREPICETPSDAIKCFLGTEIDFLYFPEFGILAKKKS